MSYILSKRKPLVLRTGRRLWTGVGDRRDEPDSRRRHEGAEPTRQESAERQDRHADVAGIAGWHAPSYHFRRDVVYEGLAGSDNFAAARTAD